jgi:hypothetical protein
VTGVAFELFLSPQLLSSKTAKIKDTRYFIVIKIVESAAKLRKKTENNK